MIRVDGTNYLWMGAPGNGPAAATQTGFSYTSTKSSFIFDVGGKVEMNVTFLSPLTPTDQRRQSLVFSYLDVVVQSADGGSHDVQLYTDISAGKSEWSSCDVASQLTRAQNGSQETIVQLRSGTSERPAITSHTTKSTGRLSFFSVRRISRPTGGTGIGRPRMYLTSRSNRVKMLLFVELS